jgi:cell division protein FtsI (penicillin-binding protein 3)
MTTADPYGAQDIEEAAPAWWPGLVGHLGWVERAFNRARVSGKAEDDTSLRLFFIIALFAAAFLALAIGATRAALFSGETPHKAGLASTRYERADLVDRNGEVLATDVVRYGLYIRPAEIADREGTEAAIMAAAPTITRAQLDNAIAGKEVSGRPAKIAGAEHHGLAAMLLAALTGEKVSSDSAPNPTKEFFVAGGLTPAVKAKLHDLALPGLDYQEESGRYYPLEQTGAHVIGYASKDGLGLAGAEKAFDGPIRATGGRGVQALSIDLRVQAALQEELQAAADHFAVKDAVGMVVNVRTGEILALASYPSFDPNAVNKAPPWAQVDHAAATVYEPGSVFKVFTLAMGLDSGVAKVTDTFDVHSPIVLPGQTIHDYDKGDRILPLWEVFTHSSNIGAARLGLKAGADTEMRYFRDFGLFAAAPSEFVESAHPLTPKRFSENIVATTAFGHSISVSPLMLATGMSAILNGGIYRPLTFRKLEPGQAPAAGRRVIQASTSRTMLNLMRLNVTNGTGQFADVPGYRVGGKTGTATKLINGHYSGGKTNLASFAAVFPADGPLNADRYYTLIMMDEPRVTAETGGFTTGGAVSAPIAGKVIARIAPLLGVTRVEGGPVVAKANRDNVDPSHLTEGGL